MIQKAGCNVLSAADGRSALEFFDGREIDLVITDLNMPEMNGLELISEIRLKEYYGYMPVVLFVADNEKDRRKIMDTSGATILFDKNNIKEKIIPTIKKMLG
jgi:two-component system chemotaxis response regulator CheY